MPSRGSLLARRHALVVVTALALVLVVMSYVAANRASGADQDRCQQFAADSVARAEQVSGSGERVVVIGDSWSAGLGLTQPARSWPVRLDGRVHVAGFSGSGFSAEASPCGKVSFADRAPAVVDGADLVVVEGGLNDFDRSNSEIRAGFRSLARTLRRAGIERVVVVGPAAAPSRAARVGRVDRLLARQSAKRGYAYVSTLDLDLPYLEDRLHLTSAGHRQFGDAVAERITVLTS